MTDPQETQIGMLLFLLVLFTVKHFLADYPLQTAYMLRKSRRQGWFKPLLCHALVHGLLTLLVLVFPLGWKALLFGAADMLIHGVVDYWKAQTRFRSQDKRFWNALGLDQMFHHLTYIPLAYMAVHCI